MTSSHSKISVARDFSMFPAGRLKADCDKRSGELFRELLASELKRNDSVTVCLDGTMGFGSSWLEEAFGGLVTKDHFDVASLLKKLTIQSKDKSLVDESWSYITK